MTRNIFRTPTRFRRFNAHAARVTGVVAAAAAAALILWHAARRQTDVEIGPALRVATAPPAPTAHPAEAAGLQPGVASTLAVIVARNDSMDAIFRRMSLDTSDLAAIRNLPGIRSSLDYLKPGDAIQVTRRGTGEIEKLSRRVSETQTLEVVRGDSGFAASMVDNPVQVRVRTAGATIDSSLFQAAESSDISDRVALKLANVFAYDIDFVLEIRDGDRFTVEYEQINQDGKYLRDGDVLAAEFVNDGRTYRAVRFTTNGGSSGYYTPGGKPLRKAFLRAPVDFTRVSSVFATNRLHPILNRIRGHMGTDYAAPSGTPIHAAGEGRVCFAGTRGGYGNAIMLLHGNDVSTLYGHMSRFAKNVHFGSHVNQGDVIGYVGMTGLATGPHLHYEYLKNGVHMNPQTVSLPGAEALRAEALARFSAIAAPLLGNLDTPLPPAAIIAAGTTVAAGGTTAALHTSGIATPGASTPGASTPGASPSKILVN